MYKNGSLYFSSFYKGSLKFYNVELLAKCLTLDQMICLEQMYTKT